jgi:hypothetical protein
LQFIPQTAAQPAIAENARTLQGQFGELDLAAVENVGWDVAVFREQTDLFGQLRGFVEHVQTLAPGRLLRVIDLAQVKDGALVGVTRAQTAVFDNAPVAMHLAIFFASVETQEHLLAGSVSWLRRGVEGGRSPLAGFGKREACRSASYVTPDAKKSENRFASMKFRIAAAEGV